VALALPASGVTADKSGPAAEPDVVDDFSGEPLDRWRVEGTASELDLEAGTSASGGRAVQLKGMGEKACTIRRDLAASDWRAIATVSLYVFLDSPTSQPLRLMLGNGRSRVIVRRFDVEPGAWREVTLRLADFRDGTGQLLCDLSKIDHVAIRWDKGEGMLRVDDLRRSPGSRGTGSSRLTLAERVALAFPNGAGKALEGRRFTLLTDAPALQGKDGEKLIARFDEALQVLLDVFRLPAPAPDTPPVPVHVFATREGYQSFVQRLAQSVGAQIPAPKSQGVTLLRLPLAYQMGQGWDQPVFVEEAMHGALCELLGIASEGNWVQEGLPVAVRARLHPATVKDIDLAAAFAGKGSFVPWEQLFEKPTVGSRAHPQLLTIFEFLAAKHADKLPQVWSALVAVEGPLHKAGPDAIAKVLGVPRDDLEKAWLEWGRAKYPKKAG
jgi:hypothetical protein